MRKLPSLRKPDPEPEPAPQDDPPAQPPQSPRGLRISIKSALMLMLVVCVAAAGWGGMRQSEENRVFYIMFATAAPVMALLVVGVLHQWLRRRRR